jgi:vacuolar iron transporter family protein
VGASVALAALAMFAIGAGTTLFTGRGVLFSGLRQLAIGMVAAGVTYGVGKLIGVSLAG